MKTNEAENIHILQVTGTSAITSFDSLANKPFLTNIGQRKIIEIHHHEAKAFYTSFIPVQQKVTWADQAHENRRDQRPDTGRLPATSHCSASSNDLKQSSSSYNLFKLLGQHNLHTRYNFPTLLEHQCCSPTPPLAPVNGAYTYFYFSF